MGKNNTYDHALSVDFYKKREDPPEKDDEWIIVAVMVVGVLFLLGQCVG